MKGLCFRFVFRFAALALVGLTWAEQPATPPPTGSPLRNLSAKISEAVLAKLPKYVPKETKAADPNETGDASDSRGDVLHLKKVVVNTARALRLSQDDMLSANGRVDLALKKYPGLMLGPFAFLNRGIAGAMAAEDRDAQKSADLLEAAQNANRGDNSKEAKRINDLAVAAAQRSTWP
jgi:hypothetical protein